MNALSLLHNLEARGVILEADGESLKVDAPAGGLTDEDRAALSELKPILLEFLSRSTGPQEPRDDGCRFKVRRSKYPGYTSLYDPVDGRWHDFPTRDCLPSIVAEANAKRKGPAREA